MFVIARHADAGEDRGLELPVQLTMQPYLGYSVGVDVSEHSRYFSDFRLGYQWNTGRDVDGHSLVLAWWLK